MYKNYLVTVSAIGVNTEQAYDITDRVSTLFYEKFGFDSEISEPAYDPNHDTYVIDVQINIEN